MNQKRRTKPRPNENNVYAQQRGSSCNSSFMCILLFVILALVTFSAYEYKEVDEGAGYIHEQEEVMKKLKAESEEKINSLQQQLRGVTKEKNAAQGSLHELEMKLKKDRKNSDTGGKNEVHGGMTEALDLAQSQISGLEKAMQKRAKLDVIERCVICGCYVLEHFPTHLALSINFKLTFPSFALISRPLCIINLRFGPGPHR